MEKIVIDNKVYSEKIERNILIVLSCLIQKVSGTPTAQTLMDGNIEFALRCLVGWGLISGLDIGKRSYGQEINSVLWP